MPVSVLNGGVAGGPKQKGTAGFQLANSGRENVLLCAQEPCVIKVEVRECNDLVFK